MSNRKWIALGVMTFVMLIGLMFPQKDGSGLTDEQRLEITDKCSVDIRPVRQLLLAQSQFLSTRADPVREYAPER